jgi:hypothetical protein
MDWVERRKGGAVREDRSPRKVAIDYLRQMLFGKLIDRRERGRDGNWKEKEGEEEKED